MAVDDALEAWVAAAMPGWGYQRRHAMMRRIGWRGNSRPTLEEIAADEGLTRERVRQLQVKLEDRLKNVQPPATEPLRRVAQVISDHRRNPTQPGGRLLHERELVAAPMSDFGLRLLFSLVGKPELFEEYDSQLAKFQPRLREAVGVAKALTRSVGVVSVDWVREESGGWADTELLVRELRLTSWCTFLDAEWFWDPGVPGGRNRLVNVSIKMLAACGPLQVRELSGGLDRMVRWGRMPHLPSAQALRLFYQAHPGFQVTGESVVSSSAPLDPEVELDTTELALYRILRAAPEGFLDRRELFRQGTSVGINQNTWSVYLTYSSIIDSPMQDRWMLRGTDVSPVALEARRKQRARRHATNEWTSRGSLLLERETPDYWGLVVSVPKALRPYVAERVFTAVDERGVEVGVVRWDENGTSWGYSPFLQRSQASEGDVLVAEFDLVENTVQLDLRRSAPEAHQPRTTGRA